MQVNAPPLQATAVTLTASPVTAVSGQTIALTAKVAPTTGTSTPTGTVTFQDGSSAIGSSTLAAGTGTLALSTLSVGTHSLNAVYGGDSSRFAIYFQDGFGNHHRSYGASSDTRCRLRTYALKQRSDHDASHARILDGLGSPGERIQCFVVLRLLRPAQWMGMQLCSPHALRGAPESTKLTISATNSGQLMTSPSGLISGAGFADPVVLLRLSQEGHAGRMDLALIFLLATLAGCGTSFKSSPTGAVEHL